MVVGGVLDDLPTDEGSKGRHVHPERRGRDLRRSYGVRHAVYTYEDPKRWRPMTALRRRLSWAVCLSPLRQSIDVHSCLLPYVGVIAQFDTHAAVEALPKSTQMHQSRILPQIRSRVELHPAC